MATARDTIKRAMRATGFIDSSQEPTPNQANDALEALNTTVKAMFGQEVGLKLDTVDMTAATTGVPWAFYQVAFASAGATLTFPASPQDGWRVGFTDAKANFGTYNLTVNPNSRQISTAVGTYSASNQTYSTNSTTKTFFFRSDAGWTEEAVLALGDTLYFPLDLHGDMADILAVILYPQYWPGQQPDAMLVGLAQAARERFAARYNGRAMAPRARK